MKRAFAGRRVVISGAASGIGRATALHFARQGAHVIVYDVNDTALAPLADDLRAAGAASASAHGVDVAEREAVSRFAQTVLADGAPDVLVNNAGVGLAGGFLATSLDDWHWLFSVNLWGVVHACHFFAPAMVARGAGQIVNVASAAGFYSSSTMTAYGTSKYAVLGLSEALREELAPRGVGVSVVCPGFIATPIIQRMRVRGAGDPEAERARIERFYHQRGHSPERVAEAIAEAVRSNPALLPVTREAWGLYWLKRAAPELVPRVARAFGRWSGRSDS